MRFLIRALVVVGALNGIPSAQAQEGPVDPPVSTGAPRWTAAGPGLSDDGSRWMVRTDVEEPDAPPFVLWLNDGWASSSQADASGTMWLEGDLRLHRQVTFHPWGWSELLSDEAGTPVAEGRVFTAGPEVFGLELRSLEASPRTWWLAGDGAPPGRLAQDGVALSTDGGVPRWVGADFELAPGERTVIFFAEGMSEADFAALTDPLWAIPDWEVALTVCWAPWQHLPGQATLAPEGRTEEAIALLRHAQTQVGEALLPLRSKGRVPRLELASMGLIARAYAQLPLEVGGDSAEAMLAAFHEAQREDGSLPAWLAPSGETTTETRVPRFLTGWLSIAERLVDPEDLGTQDRERAAQQQALALERGVLTFWTENRDRDDDAALECDGGREAATPGSPRLNEVWSGDVDAPAGTLTDRLPLNCVEAGAWSHALAVEAARLAGLLGEDDTALRNLATRRSLEVDDPVNGHWIPEQNGWFDYVRVGADKSREALETRTHVLWAPLTTGLSREGARIREVVAQLLEPATFSHEGVASVAVGTPLAGYDPEAPWRGAIQPEVEWSALLALSRYGYEEDAQALRARLLSRALTSATTPEGAPVGPADDVVAAAVHLLAAAHVDEEEVLLFEKGELKAQRRSGHFQRVFHATTGRLLLEVVSEDLRVRPRLTLTSETQLFAGEPMEIEVSDPAGVLGEGSVRILFPSLTFLGGKITRADGSTEGVSWSGGEFSRDGWVARPGDRLSLIQFEGPAMGGGPCGCSGTGSAPTAWGALLLFLLGWRVTVRRLHRD